MTVYAPGYVAPPDTSGWSKNPSKYPFPVGSNYQGEDPSGYWVYGGDNLYHPNAQAQQNYNQASGISPKPPTTASTLGPIAAVAGTVAGAQALANPKTYGAIGSLFGSSAPADNPNVDLASAVPSPFGGAATGAPAATSGTDLSSAAPFSFGGPSSAPAAGAAPATPTGLAGSATPFSLGGAPGGSTLGSTASGMFGSGGSTVAGQGLLGSTGASPLLAGAGVAAGAATGLAQGLGVSNFAQGKPLSLGEQGALALPTFGLSFLANPIEGLIGHGANYYDAKQRQLDLEHIAEQLNGKGSKTLSFQKPDGSTYSVNSTDFRHDPTTFNYDQSSPTMAQDIGAGNAAAALLGFKPGSKQFTDWSGLIANASKNGVPASSLFSSVGLPSGHDQLYGQVILDLQNKKIDSATADQLKNGLDQAFGVGAYASGAHQPAVPMPTVGDKGGAPQMPTIMPRDNNVNTGTSQTMQSAVAQGAMQNASGLTRVSPGVYKDASGQTVLSKTGTR